MINDVKKILEVDKYDANKLLKTGNCILLGVSAVSTNNEDCPGETEFLYSIGQIRYGHCDLCSADTVEYDINNLEKIISATCLNGNYSSYLK